MIPSTEMAARWLQVTIEPTRSIQLDDSVREVIYQAIRNLVVELEKDEKLRSFHFFHEHGNVELRLCVEGDVDEAIDRHFSDCDQAISNFTVSDYQEEVERYGTDGWPIARAFFETCSRFVLMEFYPYADLGSWYSIGKLVHCFLNQYFASRSAEAQFYADELSVLIASGFSLAMNYDPAWRDSIESAWSGKGWTGRWNWEVRRRRGREGVEVIDDD